MTGFDSLSGDILPAAAEKLTARGLGKAQTLGSKAGDKASKAFGSHLSRLALEHESKFATPKTGGHRSDTPVTEARTFALPSGPYDGLALMAASTKILAVSRISEEAESASEQTKADIASGDSAQGAAELSTVFVETRPHVMIHHAAMGFGHELTLVADADQSSAGADVKGHAESSHARSGAKLDDARSGVGGGPEMPSQAIDVPELSATRLTESSGFALQHSGIRAPVPTKIAVVSQETHFEPVLPSSTLQQISSAIGEEIPIVQETADLVAGVTSSNERPAPAGPVKMLTLQLDPASLGSLTVKMKLTGAAIEVQIAASRHETAQLLEHDRGALSRLLQASGYETDIATVQVQSAAASSSGDAGQSTPSFQGQPGQSSAQGQFDGSSHRTGEDRPGAHHNQQERRQSSLPQEERNGNDSAAKSGTLYL